MNNKKYSVYGISGIGEIKPGDDLAAILIEALKDTGLEDGDILVVTHKIVSKAEGALRDLSEVTVGSRAEKLASITGKDPRHVQVVLEESKEVLYATNGFLLCLDKRGAACANAAVDASNALPGKVVLLPKDPDESAKELRKKISSYFGKQMGVVICDTHGRPFRNGAVGVAVGAAGIMAQKSYIGCTDRSGRVMESSVEAVSDELAAAGTLIMGQGNEGIPAVLIRGLSLAGSGCAKENVRSEKQDACIRLMLKNRDFETE